MTSPRWDANRVSSMLVSRFVSFLSHRDLQIHF
jgi:hypothetical protein